MRRPILTHAAALLADGIGLVWADRWRSTTLSDGFLFWPLQAHEHVRFMRRVDRDKIERGGRLAAGIKYARLAELAQQHSLGDADALIGRAQVLAPTVSEENLRQLASQPFGAAKSPYLTSRTWEELYAGLAVRRAEMGFDDEQH